MLVVLRQISLAPSTIDIIIGALVVAVCIYALLIMPIRYIIGNKSFKIRKLLWPVNIKYDIIDSVEVLYYEDLKITFRLFASGGVWGFNGLFYSSKYGKIHFMTTSIDKELILIQLKNEKKIIISPIGDLECFIREIKKHQ